MNDAKRTDDASVVAVWNLNFAREQADRLYHAVNNLRHDDIFAAHVDLLDDLRQQAEHINIQLTRIQGQHESRYNG